MNNLNEMQEVKQFFEEVNLENGSNYKLKVLEKFKTNELIKQILAMANDKVRYTYGVSFKAINSFEQTVEDIFQDYSLSKALKDVQDLLCTRKVTGNAALVLCKTILNSLDEFDSDIFMRVIDRNLKINMGRTQINKIHKNLIIKPSYMRCNVFNDKTSKKIKYPAILQLKSDGTYREFIVDAGVVTCNSRSGESYEYENIFSVLQHYPDGHYVGELTVKPTQELFDLLFDDAEDSDKITVLYNEYLDNNLTVLPREIGNGLINSDDIPYDNLVLSLWDYVTPEEHNNVLDKIKNIKKYENRFDVLINIVNKFPSQFIEVIEYHIVSNIKDALKYTSEWMKLGFEGSVLKNLAGVFKDGTSNDQLKLKLVISAEMRITGFTEGTGKNAEYFGALEFENDEGTIKGKVGVSSMSEKMRDEIHNNREKYLNKIIEIEFNDITIAEGSDTYAFSHPRFIEVRNDKDKTDTLKKVFAMKEMAMNLA